VPVWNAGMENKVDNELVDHNDDDEEVYDPKDLQMLEQLGFEHEENLEPSDYLHYPDEVAK
jgi:hypothetical protein